MAVNDRIVRFLTALGIEDPNGYDMEFLAITKDLFEKDNHFGGHSYTLDLNLNNKKISADIGFIVFNYKTYPNLINFFKDNSIEIEKSNMSFSVSVKDSNFEYCGKGISGMFSNKSNIFNFKFLNMFFDLIKFYKII